MSPSRSTRGASKWLSAVRVTLTKRSSPTRSATVLRVSRTRLVDAGHQRDFLSDSEAPQIKQCAGRLNGAIRLHAIDPLPSQDGHQGIARSHRDACGGRRQRLRRYRPRARCGSDAGAVRRGGGHRARLRGRRWRLVRDSAGESPFLFPLHADMPPLRQFDVEPCDARLETGHGPLRDPHRDTGGEAPRVEHPAQALHEGIRLGSPHVRRRATNPSGCCPRAGCGATRRARALRGAPGHRRRGWCREADRRPRDWLRHS